MTNKDNHSEQAAHLTSSMQALRRRAEEVTRGKESKSPWNLNDMSPEETREMFQELATHQIELEMQNEELRAAQRELDASRARYFSLYDLAPVGYISLSEKGLILEANLTAACLLAENRCALVKQPFSRFILPEDQDIYYLYLKQLFSALLVNLANTQQANSLQAGLFAESQVCELRMVQKDGTSFWAHLAATAMQDENSPIIRVILSNITDRKQAEIALLESEARYAILTHIAANDGLWDWHVPSGKAFFSSVYYRMLGYEEGEFPASYKSMRHLIHPDDIERVELGFRQSLDSANGFNLDLRMKMKSGEYQWVSTHGKTIEKDDKNKALRMVGTLTDITERKQIEAERERLNQALQDKNSELENAKLMAEKANLAKSEFLSRMSHELRTPLGAILGFAQLMECGAQQPSPAQKRNIDQILKAGWYLLELINEILDLALIESGKLSLSIEPVSLTEVMQECEIMVEPLAQKRGIRILFTPLETPFIVNADRIRVKQLLINLLSNAIKYNKEGGTVTVTCALSAPSSIRINVRDTGEGLTPEHIEQLFQPFNRLGQTDVEEGTGIGLVVCKRLIEMMSGLIGVESTVGEGSLFWVELNRTAEQLTLPDATEFAAKALTQNHGNSETYTLLYIEDNRANLMLVEDIIARRPGIHLLSAKEAVSGIEIARTSLPDVILMDINLPGINGINAMKILAEIPATAHIPIIALSANAMPRDIKKGLEAGFYRYLTKPVKINELMDTLDMALNFAKTDASLHDHS